MKMGKKGQERKDELTKYQKIVICIAGISLFLASVGTLAGIDWSAIGTIPIVLLVVGIPLLIISILVIILLQSKKGKVFNV